VGSGNGKGASSGLVPKIERSNSTEQGVEGAGEGADGLVSSCMSRAASTAKPAWRGTMRIVVVGEEERKSQSFWWSLHS
jgi:hypothetical protein